MRIDYVRAQNHSQTTFDRDTSSQSTCGVEQDLALIRSKAGEGDTDTRADADAGIGTGTGTSAVARATQRPAKQALTPTASRASERTDATSEQHADSLIATSIPLAQRAMFRAIERANEAAESGGRGAIASRLVTTAGPDAPASFGRSQLLVSLQVDALRAMSRTPESRARVEAFGVSGADLDAIDARGNAATRWYDSVVRGQGGGAQPLTPTEAREARTLARAGDTDALVARFGERFEQETGIPRGELGAMGSTARLVSTSVQREFMRIRARTGRDAEALDTLVSRHPDLGALRERIGDDRSMSFFLRRPRRNGEHRAAWYTRAARVDEGQYGRLIGALEGGADRLTSRARQIRNYLGARGVLEPLAGFASLTPTRQALLVGQLARIRHGHPQFFAEQFGSPGAPRVSTVEGVQQLIRRLLDADATSTEGDQGRSVRAFTQRYEQSRSDPTSDVEVRIHG